MNFWISPAGEFRQRFYDQEYARYYWSLGEGCGSQLHPPWEDLLAGAGASRRQGLGIPWLPLSPAPAFSRAGERYRRVVACPSCGSSRWPAGVCHVPRCVARAVRTWTSGSFFLYVFFSGRHFVCVLVSLEEYRVLGFWGDDASTETLWKNFPHFLRPCAARDAWLDSGYMVRLFLAHGRISHIIYVEVDSDPQVHSLLLSIHAEWRSVHSLMLQVAVSARRLLALGNLDITTSSPRTWQKQRMDGFGALFAPFFWHSISWSAGVWGQCTGTDPIKFSH